MPPQDSATSARIQRVVASAISRIHCLGLLRAEAFLPRGVLCSATVTEYIALLS